MANWNVRVGSRYPAQLVGGSGVTITKSGGVVTVAISLTSATITSPTLNGAIINSATINNSTLTTATLSNATLTSATLANAILTTATLSAPTLTNATLNTATLAFATLTSATLSNALLTTATLSNATLTTATLSNATLTTATLSNPTLTTATLSGGTINNMVIGGSTAAAGTFTALTANGSTILGGSASDAVTVNAGWVTQPNMPAFLAYNSAQDDNVTGDATNAVVDFDTEILDRGADFAADTFTAPVTGIYAFSANVSVDGIVGATHTLVIRLITSNRSYIMLWALPSGGFSTYNLSVAAADMDAADTAIIQVTASGGAKVVDIYGAATADTSFSGHLVG